MSDHVEFFLHQIHSKTLSLPQQEMLHDHTMHDNTHLCTTGRKRDEHASSDSLSTY